MFPPRSEAVAEARGTPRVLLWWVRVVMWCVAMWWVGMWRVAVWEASQDSLSPLLTGAGCLGGGHVGALPEGRDLV